MASELPVGYFAAMNAYMYSAMGGVLGVGPPIGSNVKPASEALDDDSQHKVNSGNSPSSFYMMFGNGR